IANVTSSAGSVQESLFTYQLTGGSYIGSTIILSNSFETGDGASTGLQNFCAGGSFGLDGVSGCTGTPGALATVDGAQNQDASLFSAVSFLSVTNDLTFDGGLAGTAAGGTFVNQFTTAPASIPEPLPLLLTSVGLTLLLCRRVK
ncbi:MAG TPA: hypothetical protein VK604_06495, partial [Bryobacteraceae bacterium]|nr:hypothetical protein [Bryobacteraceae bacterium]